MRNKKYRLWKVVIMLLAIVTCLFLMLLIPFEKWQKIFLFAGGVLLSASIPLMVLPQFFEVQDDRIIARGTNSLNKKYDRSFTKCVFMFDDIEDISVEDKKLIWIRLKDGSNVSIAVGGFFQKQEIISLVYEARAQIKGYEQVYVNKD